MKQMIRRLNGYRCERCQHPFPPGTPGEWSPCDERCTHDGPLSACAPDGVGSTWKGPDELEPDSSIAQKVNAGWAVWAQWRILTVHHLNGVKHDLRWWNLAALCQRCHLTIQGRVRMERAYHGEHTEWFKPHAAGWYAWSFLGIELARDETLERLDELLDLEHRQGNLW